jgi:hypothetical protein
METRSTQLKVSPFELGEVARSHYALHGFSLHVVLRRIHADEVRRLKIGGPIRDDDACRGGEKLVMLLDLHDVVEFGDGPVGTEGAFWAVVHRVFGAQAREVGRMCVGLVELRLADVDLVERHARRIQAGEIQHLMVALRRFCHGAPPSSDRLATGATGDYPKYDGQATTLWIRGSLARWEARYGGFGSGRRVWATSSSAGVASAA